MPYARRSPRRLLSACLCGALCAAGGLLIARAGDPANQVKAIPIAAANGGAAREGGPMTATASLAPIPGIAPPGGAGDGMYLRPPRDTTPTFAVADGRSLPGFFAIPLSTGLPAGMTFEPRALNNRGEVVGALVEPGRDGERLRRHAAIYRDGQFRRIEPLRDFGRLSLTDINHRGEAVGTLVRYRRGFPPVVHVARVVGGSVEDLGTLGVPATTDAAGRTRSASVHEFGPRIDDRGRVVVRVGDELLRWSRGGVERLGSGFAVDVSPGGVIAGARSDGESSATIWTAEGTPVRASRGIPAELHELSSSGAALPDRSVVECVNDRMQGVVAVDVGGGLSGRRATLYYRWEDGKRTRLALMRGPQSGTCINARGDVVGLAHWSPEGRMVPYLYRAGKLYDLQQVVRRTTGWTIDAVTGLNDRGQMVAFGRKDDGSFRPLLLTPVSGTLTATKRPGATAPPRASSAAVSPARG